MSSLLNDRFAPITSCMGLINGSLRDVNESFVQWQNDILAGYGQSVVVGHLECHLGDAFSRLQPLARGVRTRSLLLELGEWVAYFDNSHLGTDAAGVAAVMATRLLTTAIRLTVRSNKIKRGKGASKLGSYGATIFEVFEGNLRSRRSIACANDGGRWVFEQHGAPFLFEDLAAYASKKVRERFPPYLLERYVHEFGVDPFSERAYYAKCDGSVHGELVEIVGDLPKTITYVTLAAARKALGLE